MNSLFHHMGEKKALELFNKMQENYELSNELLQDLLSDKQEMQDVKLKMIPKQKLIQEKIKLVKDALDIGDIKRAVEIQYMEIFPVSQYIQRQLYEVMEMKHGDDASVLYQEEISIRNSETLL
jgi:2C-methyl-D-erythritol 2,4-cyclodiphosphate synthase